MRRLAFIIALSTAALLSACDGGYNTADATHSKAVAQGQALYAANCASCHGDKLQGQANWQVTQADGTLPAPPHDDSGHTWHHPDALLFDVTQRGGQASAPEGFKSAMPGFGDKLSDSEIWAVLSFIKSKWSIEAQIKQARLNR